MSVAKPGYFCIGRKRYGCTHGYCHECFWKKVKEIDELEQGKTSSLRRKSNRINGTLSYHLDKNIVENSILGKYQ